MYEQFDLDGPRFRAAVGRYDERADDLLSRLYYGLVLGSEGVVEQLRQRLAGRRDREVPPWQALQSHGSIPDRLAAYARRLGIGAQELAELSRPVRPRTRASRDALLYLLWRAGRFRLGQIAPHFGVGSAAVSQACWRPIIVWPGRSWGSARSFPRTPDGRPPSRRPRVTAPVIPNLSAHLPHPSEQTSIHSPEIGVFQPNQ